MPLETYWKRFLDAAPDAIFVVDSSGLIQYASAHAERLFDYSRDEMVGQPVEMLLPEDMHEKHRRYRQDYMDDATVRPMSLRNPLCARRKDGSLFPAHISLSPIGLGHKTHVLASVRDITELEMARSDLERSEQRLRDLIEHMPDAVAVHRDGRLVYVNSALLAYLGYETADELMGTPIMELIHPEHRALAAERIERMRRTGEKAPPVEERFVRKDGTTLVAEIHVQPMDFQGEPAFVVIGRDVTKKQELLARAMQLDRKIAVGTLAGGVAHEINNPLAYAKANVQYVLRDLQQALGAGAAPLDREQLANMVDALSDTADGLERIGRIVSDLDTFVDRQSDERSTVDVDALLETAIDLVFRQLDSNVEVVRDLPEIPFVHANRSELAEVFINLLTNALQALDTCTAEPCEVCVSTSSADGWVVVEIADTGAGMSEEVLAQAFDPFFSTRDEGEGTGLGLTIVQNTLERLGGDIEIASTPGEGTTVQVSLPTRVARDE